MPNLNRGCRMALGSAMLAASAAYADTSADPSLPDFKFSGNIRAYSFSRDYTNSTLTDLHSTSLGGRLKVETANPDGLGAALGVYFAQDIGLNNHDQNNKYINPLLMGTDYGIYTLGEAYVQYRKPEFLARIGNQNIDNPWINPSDGFMIPNLYQAGVVSYSPVPGLQFEGDRVFRYENRTAYSFSNSNIFALPYDNPHYTGGNIGAAAFGMTYRNDGISAKTWLYRFYDFAQMAWLQGGYKMNLDGLSPFVDFQFMRETGDGANLLGAVDSKVYGAKTGVALPDKLGSVYFAFNKVPLNPTAGISNGNLLSPYTQVYNTDPLYTTVMNYGLVSARGAGHAWKIGTNLKLLNEKLDAEITYSRYDTAPYVANVNALMLDLAYHLDSSFEGLTIRDRLGIEHGLASWGSSYVDNRVMLQYAF
ncbi:outer membrane porin, OprD family [mine drainage metagenome]|uniref:Outer membrane porin, OprD family n=1 Tax=mine drainage metagenome TaxID=410659 RepID=A0A1J5TJA0_9ZZZZ